jgi:hypothetical protein
VDKRFEVHMTHQLYLVSNLSSALLLERYRAAHRLRDPKVTIEIFMPGFLENLLEQA